MAESENEPWRQLYRYWLDKHVDGQPPSRADLDPVLEIPKLLRNLVLIDITPEGLVYRLVGSGIEAGVGEGMAGRKIGSSGKFQNVAKDWAEAIDFVRVNGKPRLLVARFDDRVQQASGVLLFLPLTGPARETAMIMGGYFNEGIFPVGTQIEALSVKETIV
jgi:hypothetical protein